MVISIITNLNHGLTKPTHTNHKIDKWPHPPFFFPSHQGKSSVVARTLRLTFHPPPSLTHTHISPHTPLLRTSCKGLKVKEERVSRKLRNRLPFHILLSVYKLFTWSDLGYSIILLVGCFMINWKPYNTILYYLGLAC